MSFAQTGNVQVKRAYTLRALKKSTRAPTNVSNAKRAVTCSIFLLRIRNHVLPYLVGRTALEKKTKLDYQKDKLSPLMQHSISQSELSTTKAEEANNEPATKRKRYYHKWNNGVTLLLAVSLQHKFTSYSFFKVLYN